MLKLIPGTGGDSIHPTVQYGTLEMFELRDLFNLSISVMKDKDPNLEKIEVSNTLGGWRRKVMSRGEESEEGSHTTSLSDNNTSIWSHEYRYTHSILDILNLTRCSHQDRETWRFS